MPAAQDKLKEVALFDSYAETGEYDVFTQKAKVRLLDAFERLTGVTRDSKIIDIGCGSGTFAALLHERGYKVTGVDISSKLIEAGRAKYPGLDLRQGDAENLPVEDVSFDAALLCAVLHHFPDVRKLVFETHRVVRRGGRFFAFDPNRLNPFMWLYRDPASPFYSPLGVTKNERPVLPGPIASAFRDAGFTVRSDYLGGMAYRYVASARARLFLPLYNVIDGALFAPSLMGPFRPFVLTFGVKT